MTEIEHLLTCLAEEAAEIAQAATKALRFGVQTEFDGETNSVAITREIDDLAAIIDLPIEAGAIKKPGVFVSRDAIEAKKRRVREYMAIALDDSLACMIASEKVLAEDWNTPEEDEAWNTPEEALREIKIAMAGFVEVVAEDGPLPEPVYFTDPWPKISAR